MSHLLQSCLITLFMLLTSGVGVIRLQAQLTPPVLITVSPGTRPVAPLGAKYHIGMKQEQLEAMVSFRATHYPIDSMRKVVEATGSQWVTRLQEPALADMMTDLQHDPAGGVGVSAAQEAYAHAQIAARLATPGLRMQDRAHTLRIAVRIFADKDYPERLPIAERYLRQLDAMGDTAAAWRIGARGSLVAAYYHLGRSADVVRLGTQVLHLGRKVPYVDGNTAMWMYYKVVDALSGEPDAPKKIAELTALLRSTYRPPPREAIALDSGFIKAGKWEYMSMEEMIQRAAKLGTPMAPLLSNYWVNRPTTDSAVIPVNDGKIRLIEVFSYGCDGCVQAMFGLQRIQDRFPHAVQAIGTTFTLGFWANRLITPDDEAKRLHDYFATQLKLTFPVAIWKWKKIRKPNGGEEGEGVWDTPNGINYPLIVKPTVYVVDGKGRLRRIFFGGGRDQEALMVQTVEFLLREAGQTTIVATPTPTVTPTARTFATAHAQ
jgi:hypothetical protein